MGLIIAKKENFNGLHNYLKNHFKIKIPFLVILMNYIINHWTHNYQKGIF